MFEITPILIALFSLLLLVLIVWWFSHRKQQERIALLEARCTEQEAATAERQSLIDSQNREINDYRVASALI